MGKLKKNIKRNQKEKNEKKLNKQNEELAANLRGYGLTQETSEGVIGTPIGSKVGITFNRETYEFSVNLIDYDNNTISSSATINLPIENLVVDVRYEELSEPDSEGHTKFMKTCQPKSRSLLI